MINKFRLWCRRIHRDLSYIFSGVLLMYAASGFMLNHKEDFNSNFDIKQERYTIESSSIPEEITDEYAISLCEKHGEQNNFVAAYDNDENSFKVFIKGGSSITVNRESGDVLYESIKKRPVLSAINRLHYNPTRAWTLFSDVFLVCLVLIVLTGLFMIGGKHGLWGRGGIELIIGILIPVVFMLLL